MPSGKIISMVSICYFLVCFIMCLSCRPAINAKSAKSSARSVNNIVIIPGKSIEIRYHDANKSTVVKLDQHYSKISLAQPDSVSYIAGLLQNRYYGQLGFSLFIDWEGKIKIIDTWSELAATQEGVHIGDDFEKVKKIYGDSFQKFIPYENQADQSAHNNYQTFIYHSRGIVFYGTINPSRITCISIMPPKLARYTRYIKNK